MSNMADPKECARWILEVERQGYGKRPDTNPFSIHAVAKEQRENLRGIENHARWTGCTPTWCTIPDYRRSVAMLIRSARKWKVAR